MRARARAVLVLGTALLLCFAFLLAAQDTVYVCPMDPDVRSHAPGTCSRCGMKLVANLPDPVEYLMDLMVTPHPLKPGQPATIQMSIKDPWKNRPVTHFQIVHEKLFHMFVVSQDLEFFVHDHPTFNPQTGEFDYAIAFPKPGMYRVLGDFYPDGATPQLIAKTVIIPGKAPAPVVLTQDYSTKKTANLQVELKTDPPEPIVGQKVQMYFRVAPVDGLEKYLGAWAHMLAASDDLIDLIHSHPILADGGPQIQFSLVFPRARTFRIWVQFQRSGVVNTARFDVPVKELK